MIPGRIRETWLEVVSESRPNGRLTLTSTAKGGKGVSAKEVRVLPGVPIRLFRRRFLAGPVRPAMTRENGRSDSCRARGASALCKMSCLLSAEGASCSKRTASAYSYFQV